MTTRISKACHECRARKIRCNGDQPCQHCTARGSHCAYRAKARTRLRRGAKPPGNVASPVANEIEHIGYKAAEPSPNDVNDVDRAINTHSVAATHRASPSCLLQLYYGPSSMFSLMHSIYHQIEGTRPNSPTRQGVEEIGPGLDLFSHRRLFFGDLADTQPSRSRSDDYSGIFLEMDTARRFLERYLATYWFGLPVMPKDEHRHRLSNLLRPPALFDFDSAENIIIVLSMAIGAHMLGEDATSDFLYQKAKQGIAKLDEAVNVQMVQVYLLMGQLQLERASPNSGFLHIGTAVRRAVAVGLHKEAGGRAGDGQQEIDQRRTTFWALYFWET